MSIAPETGSIKGMRSSAIVASLIAMTILCGCSKNRPPAERAASPESKPAAAEPANEPESNFAAIDPATLEAMDISKVPPSIIEQIDKEYIGINGASIAKEPINSARAYQIDLDNNGPKEWIVVYSGPDDTINGLFESDGDDSVQEEATDTTHWRDIGAVYGSIIKFGSDSTDGHINIHTETYNGEGKGKFCDGACDHLLFAWNGQSYENATP